jgi:hypothetical protein
MTTPLTPLVTETTPDDIDTFFLLFWLKNGKSNDYSFAPCNREFFEKTEILPYQKPPQ